MKKKKNLIINFAVLFLALVTLVESGHCQSPNKSAMSRKRPIAGQNSLARKCILIMKEELPADQYRKLPMTDRWKLLMSDRNTAWHFRKEFLSFQNCLGKDTQGSFASDPNHVNLICLWGNQLSTDNSPHAQILRSHFGFTFQKPKGKSATLKPPRDIKNLFLGYAQFLEDLLISQPEINSDDLIHMGILTRPEDLLISRPKINHDDQTHQKIGFKLLYEPSTTDHQNESIYFGRYFKHSTWEKSAKDNFFLLGDGSTWYHDLAHFTVFIEFPELMFENARFYRRLSKEKRSLSSFIDSGGSFEALSNQDKLSARLVWSAEWATLINLNLKGEIIQSLPGLFRDKRQISSVSVAKELMNDPERLKSDSRAISLYYKRWVWNIGAASRDGVNMLYHAPLESLLSNLTIDLNGRIGQQQLLDADFAQSNLLALGMEISALYQLLYESERQIEKPLSTSPTFRQLSISLKGGDLRSQKLTARLSKVLSDKVSRFEAALYTGIREDLWPDKAFREATQDSIDTNSSLYRFIHSFAAPLSPLQQIFEN